MDAVSLLQQELRSGVVQPSGPPPIVLAAGGLQRAGGLGLSASQKPLKLDMERLTAGFLRELNSSDVMGRPRYPMIELEGDREFYHRAFTNLVSVESLPEDGGERESRFLEGALTAVVEATKKHRLPLPNKIKFEKHQLDLAAAFASAFVFAYEDDPKVIQKEKMLRKAPKLPSEPPPPVPTLPPESRQERTRRARASRMSRLNGPGVEEGGSLPQPDPTPQLFSVGAGPCTVDAAGCALSPGYPGNYTSRSTCVIRVNPDLARPINVDYFHTEMGYDFLIVNGIRFSGRDGPHGVIPSADILWHADYATAGMGWRLCPGPQVDAEQLRAARTLPMLIVSKGPCVETKNGCVTSRTPGPLHKNSTTYRNGQQCIIDVTDAVAVPLDVKKFDTEDKFDVLIVNGHEYSGTDGPEAVIPQGQIEWTADGTRSRGGWRLCPHRVPTAARPRLLAAPRPRGEDAPFRVSAGRCTVDAAGCALSPRPVPKNHTNWTKVEQQCVIRVETKVAQPLRVERFDTEANYDLLSVNGVRYSGSHGPDGVVPYEDIVWFSDYSSSGSGWKLCTEPLPAAQQAAPVALAGGSRRVVAKTGLFVSEGNCQVDTAGCLLSPNYPLQYGHAEKCSISAPEGNQFPLRVDDFLTEAHGDVLTVNGKSYSGHWGPDGVVPEGQILWSSDPSVARGGWRLCLAAPAGSGPAAPSAAGSGPTPNAAAGLAALLALALRAACPGR